MYNKTVKEKKFQLKLEKKDPRQKVAKNFGWLMVGRIDKMGVGRESQGASQ